MYIFHRLFFRRVVNHEDASRIRTEDRPRLRVSDISGSYPFQNYVPLEEKKAYPTRWIKTKKKSEEYSPLFRRIEHSR